MLLFVILFLTLVALLVAYAHYQTGFWRRRGVDGPPPTIFLGNLQDLDIRKRPIPYQLAEWTQKYGKVYGVQRGNTHALVVSDQQLAREVMNEKFDCFYARDLTPLNGNPDKKAVAHVFLARGLRWKRLRALTSMVFTTKSLRKIYPLVTACGEQMCKNLDEDLEKTSIIDFAFNLKEFTADIILRSAFGRYETRTFIHGLVGGVLEAFNQLRGFIFQFGWICPILGGPLGEMNRWIALLQNRHFAKFFLDTRREIGERKKLKDANPNSAEEARDFVDLLMESESNDLELKSTTEFSKKAVHVDKRLTKSELVGTCILFMVAGFDTTANTLAFTVYYLALHPETQEKLRQEVLEVCGEDGNIDYDSLPKMKYSEAVMKETLRLNPIAAMVVSRRCMKATTLGGIQIEPGMDVVLDSITLQRDPAVWGEDSSEFKPERWLDPSVPSAQFYAFGEGPRICVGMRLAVIEQKVALAMLLRRYRIHEVPETRAEHHVGGIILSPKTVKVRLEKI